MKQYIEGMIGLAFVFAAATYLGLVIISNWIPV